MTMKKHIIQTASLQEFLSLLDPEAVVVDLELSDTWHPSAGIVDEKFLADCDTVGDILDFPYDFRGLILLKCCINGLNIEFKNEAFEVSGEDWRIHHFLYGV